FYVPDLKEPLRLGALPPSVRVSPDCPGSDITKISLANSFGIPSASPEVWQADLERTRGLLKPGQILITSVVGTADQEGSTQNELIADFAKCASQANEI